MASLSRSEAQSGRGRHGYTDPHKPHGTHTEIAPTHTRDPHTNHTHAKRDGHRTESFPNISFQSKVTSSSRDLPIP
eukprot:scaffold60748_cov71-Phaeocystis_antarctica.AAC.2